MYNTKTFPTPPDSWSVVFVNRTYRTVKPTGRVQAYDGPIYIADAALFVKATQPQLGINDPYQLTEEQYAAVLKVLRDQHAPDPPLRHDTTVQMSDFKNEGVVASSARHTGECPESRKPADRDRLPERGRHGLGRHHYASRAGKTPDVCLQMDELVADAKVQGDLAAWFGSAGGGARV